MTRSARAAAYIRVAADSVTLTMLNQRTAISHAARARGWADPIVYLDVDGEPSPGGTRPALARLAAAISTGRHDALLISVGTICGLSEDILTVLGSCSRHGVAVECVTPRAPVAASEQRP